MIYKNFLVSLLIIAFISGGCAGASRRPAAPNAALQPQAVLKFNDVPVPAGFKFLSKDSYSFESAGLRVGLLKYEGRSTFDQVINFYKEQMPMYNWRLLNIVEYGERLLNFDREQETCIITLAGRGKNIIITVSIGPKAQFPKKKDK